jgi:type 2A phosphatase activator TIP41
LPKTRGTCVFLGYERLKLSVQQVEHRQCLLFFLICHAKRIQNKKTYNITHHFHISSHIPAPIMSSSDSNTKASIDYPLSNKLQKVSLQNDNKHNQAAPQPLSWKVPNGSIPSRRRHIATPPVLKQYQANLLSGVEIDIIAGISIAGWTIGTSQGPIGDHSWSDATLDKLEPLSQYSSASNGVRRKLALPEMVFPAAHIVLQLGDSIVISWNAINALTEWSQAHQHIPFSSNHTTPDQQQQQPEFRGVSVLKASNASLWKQKQKTVVDIPTTSSIFQYVASERDEPAFVGRMSHLYVMFLSFCSYDWTYSSPFSVSVAGLKSCWRRLKTSGMPMHLLTDQTVPILYFDQIILMEDDLHDNGLVQYSAKVRVMPFCVYVLSKLFVRIDNVLLRVRECRFLLTFTTKQLYRDITWRECPWQELTKYGLPTDVRAWTQEGDGGTETPGFSMMLSKLPKVDLPEDIMEHCEGSY